MNRKHPPISSKILRMLHGADYNRLMRRSSQVVRIFDVQTTLV
jgi:hypothetical protein